MLLCAAHQVNKMQNCPKCSRCSISSSIESLNSWKALLGKRHRFIFIHFDFSSSFASSSSYLDPVFWSACPLNSLYFVFLFLRLSLVLHILFLFILSNTLVSYTPACGCGCNILWCYLRWVKEFSS